MLEPDRTDADAPWTIVLLTCRNARMDFRLPLARELASLGHEVLYVFVKRVPTVTDLSKDPVRTRETTLPRLVRDLQRLTSLRDRVLVFDSTNLAVPIRSMLLNAATKGVWCFDLHDDLLYDYTGLRRIRLRAAQAMLTAQADFTVHAAPTLRELFPTSHHLGNASDLTPLPRSSHDLTRVLVLATLDPRFDIELLEQTASLAPDLSFHIYGQLNDESWRLEQFRTLFGRPNIEYQGAYDATNLRDILQAFSIALAPYVVDSRLTRYIDPLRYYHCLNSGMEVVTTDIPAVHSLERYLHVIRSPRHCADVLARLRADRQFWRNDRSTATSYNWHVKARRLMAIAAQVRSPESGNGPVDRRSVRAAAV